jgi:uncharacterized membrane protein (UPF0136 family)
MSFIPTVARYYYALFGLFTLAGGVIGFVKAGSTLSLLMGGVSGIILLLAAYVRPKSVVRAQLALVLTPLGLLFFFGPKWLATHALMPAGLMTFLSLGCLAFVTLEAIEKFSSKKQGSV